MTRREILTPATTSAVAVAPANAQWVFASCRVETAGLDLALSRNGLYWLPLNGNRPVFAWPFAHQFRNPSLCLTPDGGFRMVRTTACKSRITMGIATTGDLNRRTDGREVVLMAGIDGALRAWAPDFFTDSTRRRWIAHWSSSVEGRFPGTRRPQPSWSNRVFCAESTGDLHGGHCLVERRVFSTLERHVDLPPGNQHGGILRITAAEFARLKEYTWTN